MAVHCLTTAPKALPYLITLLILIGLPVSHQLSTGIQGSVQAINFQTSNLRTETSLFPEGIKQALDIVRNVESMPSCAKIATSALLHSCSTLEGSISQDKDTQKRGSDLFIDEEAGIYSVRLAVCELNDADFLLPKDCRSFVPTEQTSKRRGIRGYWLSKGPSEPSVVFETYDKVTQTNLKQCRQALSSSAVAWTSYSNNRQNAAVICRAMQSEIAKDDHIEIGKILAETVAASTDSLQDALEQIRDLTVSYRELSTAMPQFQVDLAKGNQKQLEHVQRFWAEIERVQTSLLEIATGVGTIRDEVHAANYDVASLRSVVNNAADASVAEIKNSFGHVASGMTSVSVHLDEIHQRSTFVKQWVEKELVESLYHASRDLSMVNTLIPQMANLLSIEIDTHTQRLDASIEHERLLMALHHENKRMIEETTEGLRELNFTARSLAIPYLLDWPAAHNFFHDTTAFIAHTAVYTLLGFGIWDRFFGFSFLSSAFASLGTGIALAWSVSNPVGIFRSLFDNVIDSSRDMNFVVGFLIGFAAWASVSAALATCKALIGCAPWAKRYDGSAEYDPSSPELPSQNTRLWLV